MPGWLQEQQMGLKANRYACEKIVSKYYQIESLSPTLKNFTMLTNLMIIVAH